jgi:hypothetical protein
LTIHFEETTALTGLALERAIAMAELAEAAGKGDVADAHGCGQLNG